MGDSTFKSRYKQEDSFLHVNHILHDRVMYGVISIHETSLTSRNLVEVLLFVMYMHLQMADCTEQEKEKS